MIEGQIIQEIRDKSDIVDVISNYLPLSKKGKNYFGVCPFHDDTNPSMSVSKEKQIYTCFSCGATGNVITFVMDYEKISYKEAIAHLGNKIGIDLKIGKVASSNDHPYKIYETVDKYYQNNLQTSLGHNAKEYLKKRKISDEIIKEFGVGLSIGEKDKATKLLIEKGYKEQELVDLGLTNKNDYGYNDVFINRIMFPLWNETGHIVGYSGRIYDQTDDAKYVNTKETFIFKKGLLLYNYHRAKEAVRESKKIIIMEGFMDVIRAYSVGIKNVVAAMGTAVTSEQARLIKKLSDDVYLCFDGDSAGEKATLACGNELIKMDINPKVIRLSDNDDPDSYILKYGFDKFNDYINNPMSFIDFKIDYYKKGYSMNNSADVAKYIKELMKEVVLIKDNILLELTLKKISSLVNVSYDTLRSIVNKENKENIVIKQIVKKKTNDMINKYEKTEKIVLYYMLTDENIIVKYRNNIGFLPTPDCRNLLYEIIAFYEKYKTINIADFITFLGDKKPLIEMIGKIMELNYDEEYNGNDFDNYINVLREYSTKREQERLRNMLQEENDFRKKQEQATKRAVLKMRSEENVR